MPLPSWEENWNNIKIFIPVHPWQICTSSTYWSSIWRTISIQDRFLEQLQRAAMGYPISLIVSSLYTEDFEIKAINTAEHPARIWKRHVDDTFVVIESTKKEKFLQHINKMDPNIQFRTEEARTDGPSLSWIHWWQHNLTTLLLQMCTKSPHT